MAGEIIVEDAERAGRAIHTIFLDDLDARVADIPRAPSSPMSWSRIPARRVSRSIADGNEIGFGVAIV